MAEAFGKKRREGKAQLHSSGFGGSGFKFDASEDNAVKAYKKVGGWGAGPGGGGARACVCVCIHVCMCVCEPRALPGQRGGGEAVPAGLCSTPLPLLPAWPPPTRAP